MDRSNARDLEQVVRLLREVDVSPVSLSSTTGCETSRSEMDRWKILHSAKNLKLKEGTRNESCGLTSKGLSLCFSELNYKEFKSNKPEFNYRQ